MIVIKCDSCDFEADAAAKNCPQLLEILTGGDPIDGDGSETIADWHACATCREAFFKHVPAEVRSIERGGQAG